MKNRKIWSIVLSVLIILGMMPVSSMAVFADDPAYTAAIDPNDESADEISYHTEGEEDEEFVLVEDEELAGKLIEIANTRVADDEEE